MKQLTIKKTSRKLTDLLISLHRQGYTNDFLHTNPENICCIQNGENFALAYLDIALIACSYHLPSHNYKYLHTVDTHVGCRGLLVTDFILPFK